MIKNNLAILGGSPVRNKKFNNRISMGSEELDAVKRVIKSDILSGFLAAPGKFFNGGKEVRKFEKTWAEMYEFNHAISINSWTAGLQVAIGAIGIEPGDEVICPPFTMSASATCVLFYGGIPIFADIDPNRFTIDPVSIRKKITSRTKAIMVVHLFGYSADMDEIMAIAKEHNLLVIEDAAQAPGVIYKGKPVGAIGDIGGFSLNFHKHIQAGEGGLLVTNNSNLALRSQLIRNHGENAVEEYALEDISNTIGSNYRFSELHAAVATEQLKKLKSILIHREKLGKYLTKRLSSIPGLSTTKVENGSTHSYYMFPIKFDENYFGISRNLFLKAVSAELPKPSYWDTTPLAEGYVKPLYLSKLYQEKIAIGKSGFPFNTNKGITYNYNKGICPVAERLHEKELLITPLVREGVEINDLKDFADAIEKVIDNLNSLKNSKLNNPNNNSLFDPVKAIEENVD